MTNPIMFGKWCSQSMFLWHDVVEAVFGGRSNTFRFCANKSPTRISDENRAGVGQQAGQQVQAHPKRGPPGQGLSPSAKEFDLNLAPRKSKKFSQSGNQPEKVENDHQADGQKGEGRKVPIFIDERRVKCMVPASALNESNETYKGEARIDAEIWSNGVFVKKVTVPVSCVAEDVDAEQGDLPTKNKESRVPLDANRATLLPTSVARPASKATQLPRYQADQQYYGDKMAWDDGTNGALPKYNTSASAFNQMEEPDEQFRAQGGIGVPKKQNNKYMQGLANAGTSAYARVPQKRYVRAEAQPDAQGYASHEQRALTYRQGKDDGLYDMDEPAGEYVEPRRQYGAAVPKVSSDATTRA